MPHFPSLPACISLAIYRPNHSHHRLHRGPPQDLFLRRGTDMSVVCVATAGKQVDRALSREASLAVPFELAHLLVHCVPFYSTNAASKNISRSENHSIAALRRCHKTRLKEAIRKIKESSGRKTGERGVVWGTTQITRMSSKGTPKHDRRWPQKGRRNLIHNFAHPRTNALRANSQHCASNKRGPAMRRETIRLLEQSAPKSCVSFLFFFFL